MKKRTTITFEVAMDLRDAFKAACRAEKSMMKTELTTFMQDFVRRHTAGFYQYKETLDGKEYVKEIVMDEDGIAIVLSTTTSTRDALLFYPGARVLRGYSVEQNAACIPEPEPQDYFV